VAAIYRHYATKHDVLAAVVFEGLDRLEDSLGNVLLDVDGPAQLDTTVRALAGVALDHRDLGVLIQRESRHLDEREQTELARRTDAVVARMVGMVEAVRHDLDHDDADFLVRSMFAVLASVSYHATLIARAAGEELLYRMASAVLHTEALPRRQPAAAPANDTAALPRASRREAVLAAAIELLARKGYAGVRMEDVGAAAGIAGPSIYEHFTGKPDLLMAALTRGAEWLQLGLSGAFAPGLGEDETLSLVLRSYIEFTLERTDLMAVFLTETIYLPDEERHALRRVQHDYVSEWVQLLRAVRPELSGPEAWFVTHAVLGLVNDYVNGGRRSRRADLAEILLEIGSEVLSA
jgi:AcrR family transcriptional regulator